jgi:hypothetical protein
MKISKMSLRKCTVIINMKEFNIVRRALAAAASSPV